MTDYTDYTQFPIGTMTPEGEVVECPYCLRPAVEQEAPNGMPFYNHGLRHAVVNNMLQIKDDSCPQTPDD